MASVTVMVEDAGGRFHRAAGASDTLVDGNGNPLSVGSGILDGDYGDIVVSGGGTVMTIDTGVVSTSKLGGDVTTAGKALLDDANAAAQRTTLGLATIASSGSASDLASGTVPTARLGAGTANSGTYLRGDQTWASAGGNSGTATLSFGASGSTSASVTVTGQTWVGAGSAVICTVVDDARAEDAAIEGLTLTVANRVAGTGFDIIGAPAIGDFVGDVTVAFVGV